MRSIGIKLADGTFYPLLEEGNPERKKLDLTTVMDNQTKVQVDVYRTETGTMEDAEFLDTLVIENLKPHENGEPTFMLDIDVDENNELKASITDSETGKSSGIDVKLKSKTLSEESSSSAGLGADEDFNFDEVNENFSDKLDDTLIDPAESVLAQNIADSFEDHVIEDPVIDEFLADDSEVESSVIEDTAADNPVIEEPVVEEPEIEDETSVSVDEIPDVEEAALDDLPEIDNLFSDDENAGGDVTLDTQDIDSEGVAEIDEFEAEGVAEAENNQIKNLDNNPGFDLPDFDSPDTINLSDAAVDVTEPDSSYKLETIEDSSADLATDTSGTDDLFDLPDFGSETTDSDSLPDFSSFSLNPEETVSENEAPLPDFDDESSDDDMDLPDLNDDLSLPDFGDMSSEENLSLPDLDDNSSDEDFSLPDFGDLSSESLSAESLSEESSSKEEDLSLPDFDDISTDNSSDSNGRFNDILNEDFGDIDLSIDDTDDNFFESLNSDDSSSNVEVEPPKNPTFVPSGSIFSNLYDDEDMDKDSSDDIKRKTKGPVIICVICAIICILAVACIFVPEKFNFMHRILSNIKLFEGKEKNTEKVIVEQTVPENKETLDVLIIEEPEAEFIEPEAEEDSIVVASVPEVVVPKAPEPPAEKIPDTRYKIKWGDTLWDISSAYYKNPWKYKYLARYNGIKNPDKIIAGKWLYIPAE